MEAQTDEEIAVLVQKGDIDSFRFLIERYEQKLTRYANKFITNTTSITDIVQDVFIKVYQNIQSFDPTQKFSSWIYRIAHNEFVNHLKSKWREKISFIDFDTMFSHPVAEEGADDLAHDRELQKLFEGKLALISAKYREVIVLYYWQELSYTEIADILHIPPSTVGIRLRRGKEILKKLVLTQHI